MFDVCFNIFFFALLVSNAYQELNVLFEVMEMLPFSFFFFACLPTINRRIRHFPLLRKKSKHFRPPNKNLED